MAPQNRFMILFLLLIPTLLISCVQSDEGRLAEIAAEHNRQQARQHQEMVELHQEVAAGTKRLVEADSNARKDWQVMSRDVQAQQNQLESDRRSLASQRQWDSLLASSFWGLGTLAVTALPLVLCWYLLHGLRHETTDEAVVNEILIAEFTSDSPLLLPVPPAPLAIDHQTNASEEDQFTDGFS